MSRIMRHEQKDCVLQLGVNIHRQLRGVFHDSPAFRRAWLIDGELAGLGGVIGSLASGSGYVWLALSQEATRYPKAMVREARLQLDELMQTRRRLETSIVEGDVAAMRFAQHLGFRVDNAPTYEGTVAMILKRGER